MPAPTPNLVPRIKAGDPAAVNEWVCEHHEQLHRWVRFGVVVRPGPFGSASDVLPNTLPEVLTGIPDHVQNDEQFLGWVRKRLRWRAIDLVRKNGAHRPPPAPAGGSSDGGSAGPEPPATDATTPSLQLTRREREDCILTGSGYQTGTPYPGVGTAPLAVLLRQIDQVPLKVIADLLELGCVELARQYYAALHPLRAGLDRLAIGNWPPAQDTDREKIHRALLELTEQQRQVIELCHLEQDAYPLFDREAGKPGVLDCRYSLREAGDVLGLRPEAVGACVYRAMKRLNEILKRPSA